MERNLLRKSEMGFVFQSHFLINYLNVRENILCGNDHYSNHVRDYINELIHELDLQNIVNRRVDQLLGGPNRELLLLGLKLINQK